MATYDPRKHRIRCRFEAVSSILRKTLVRVKRIEHVALITYPRKTRAKAAEFADSPLLLLHDLIQEPTGSTGVDYEKVVMLPDKPVILEVTSGRSTGTVVDLSESSLTLASVSRISHHDMDLNILSLSRSLICCGAFN